jgi:hypothetical protein
MNKITKKDRKQYDTDFRQETLKSTSTEEFNLIVKKYKEIEMAVFKYDVVIIKNKYLID